MNMSINKLLLWEKWRPKKLDDIILLPRIRKHFENGLNGNYIFYGHYGTGKTSLARILIGKYSKQTPFLEINCSLDTSIDTLRTEIDDFCKLRLAPQLLFMIVGFLSPVSGFIAFVK